MNRLAAGEIILPLFCVPGPCGAISLQVGVMGDGVPEHGDKVFIFFSKRYQEMRLKSC